MFLNGSRCRPRVEYRLKTKDIIGFGTSQLSPHKDQDSPRLVFQVWSSETLREFIVKYCGKEFLEERLKFDEKLKYLEKKAEIRGGGEVEHKVSSPSKELSQQLPHVKCLTLQYDGPESVEDDQDLSDIQSDDSFDDYEDNHCNVDNEGAGVDDTITQ